ncbi:hypothetical protein BXU11_02495 [Flavobacterium sp. LM5]|nr:hypothetical protein BXU11_02495 [Flavobacterium sp. LM5]
MSFYLVNFIGFFFGIGGKGNLNVSLFKEYFLKAFKFLFNSVASSIVIKFFSAYLISIKFCNAIKSLYLELVLKSDVLNVISW